MEKFISNFNWVIDFIHVWMPHQREDYLSEIILQRILWRIWNESEVETWIAIPGMKAYFHQSLSTFHQIEQSIHYTLVMSYGLMSRPRWPALWFAIHAIWPFNGTFYTKCVYRVIMKRLKIIKLAQFNQSNSRRY